MTEDFPLSVGITKKERSSSSPEVNDRPTLEQLYSLFKYTPPEASLKKEVLDFKWTPENMASMVEGLKQAIDSTVPLYGSVDKIVGFPNRMFFKASYSCPNGSPDIGIQFFDKDRTMIAVLECSSFSPDKKIPSKEVRWRLKHRLISEKYRGQEVGSQLLKVLEEGLAYIATRDKRPQRIGIEARQLGVINFALKNGYKLSSFLDRQNLNVVYSGDTSEVLIMTIPGVNNDNIPRPGFMYSIKHLKEKAMLLGYGNLSDEEIKKFDIRKITQGSFFAYFENALTIHFDKQINPII